MLQPAWYLAATDWFADFPDRPGIDDRQDLIHRLAHMLGDDPRLEPPVTVATTYLILLALEQCGDAMTYAAAVRDLTAPDRLLCGLNLIETHLAQTIQRIAEHTEARRYPGSAEAPDDVMRAIVDSLSTAGANSELVAGHLKEARLLLHGLTQ